MTTPPDERHEDLERLRAEVAKQRANNERLTVTLREARAQILKIHSRKMTVDEQGATRQSCRRGRQFLGLGGHSQPRSRS